MERDLDATISGSFKFKPEIDRTIDEFKDYNVTILEPSKGWLYIPSRPFGTTGPKPLPDEVGMSIVEIEDRFLRAVEKSDFMYIYNMHGYGGPSVGMEIAHAHFHNIPMFSKEPITPEFWEYELPAYYYYKDSIFTATPEEAAKVMRQIRGE